MQAQNRGLTERSGEVFLLDILSHRTSAIGALSPISSSTASLDSFLIVNIRELL